MPWTDRTVRQPARPSHGRNADVRDLAGSPLRWPQRAALASRRTAVAGASLPAVRRRRARHRPAEGRRGPRPGGAGRLPATRPNGIPPAAAPHGGGGDCAGMHVGDLCAGHPRCRRTGQRRPDIFRGQRDPPLCRRGDRFRRCVRRPGLGNGSRRRPDRLHAGRHRCGPVRDRCRDRSTADGGDDDAGIRDAERLRRGGFGERRPRRNRHRLGRHSRAGFARAAGPHARRQEEAAGQGKRGADRRRRGGHLHRRILGGRSGGRAAGRVLAQAARGGRQRGRLRLPPVARPEHASPRHRHHRGEREIRDGHLHDGRRRFRRDRRRADFRLGPQLAQQLQRPDLQSHELAGRVDDHGQAGGLLGAGRRSGHGELFAARVRAVRALCIGFRGTHDLVRRQQRSAPDAGQRARIHHIAQRARAARRVGRLLRRERKGERRQPEHCPVSEYRPAKRHGSGRRNGEVRNHRFGGPGSSGPGMRGWRPNRRGLHPGDDTEPFFHRRR